MSNDEGNNNVEATPFQNEGFRMEMFNSGNNNVSIGNEIEEELSNEELLKLFDDEENGDLLNTEDMRNGQWNELKGTKDTKNKYTMNGQQSWKIRQKLSELESQVSHLTKNKVDVGITTLFIHDQTERLKQQLKIGLLANRNGIKAAKEKENNDGAASLMKERIMIQKMMKNLTFSDDVIQRIVGSDTGRWLIAALNESNKKLATIINNEISYQPVNQLLNQTLTGGDGEVPKNTFDSKLGIGDGACTALQMILNGGRKPTFVEFEKQRAELDNLVLDFSTMGETGNLELQFSNIRNAIYELKLIVEELNQNTKYQGLLEAPVYFTTLLRKLANTSNPTRSHPNFTKNHVEWQMAYRDAYQKNLKADNTVMLLSERQKFLEDSMASVVSGGVMTKKNHNGDGKGNGGGNGGGGGNERNEASFSLNTNIKPGIRVRYCGKVMRNGFCDRKGCRFTGMTKEEHSKRMPCKDFAKGKCPFPTNCRFAHPDDSYDTTKPCVHRGGINNINKDVLDKLFNKDNDAGAADSSE
jgi:hypothetical protein